MKPFLARAQCIDPALEDAKHSLWNSVEREGSSMTARIIWRSHNSTYFGSLEGITVSSEQATVTELAISNMHFAEAFLTRLGSSYIGIIAPTRAIHSKAERYATIPTWLIERAYVLH